MLDSTPNLPTKFRSKNWVEINDESRGTYNKDNQIRFMSGLCDYSDSYILVKKTVAQQQLQHQIMLTKGNI